MKQTSWDEFAYHSFSTCYPTLLNKLPYIQTHAHNTQSTNSYALFAYLNYFYHYIDKDFYLKTAWDIVPWIRMYFVIYGADIP